jgi:endonuclease YncB( thermonuclease family)
LSLALPPKPKKPDEWGGTVLFHPVATGAGALEAKGYTIVVAGIDPVPLDETCDSGGKSWPCGVRARAEFRALLRGRAVSCVIPPQADRTAIVAECRVGKRDIATWLVENGWARASAKGRFAEIEKKARADGKGIFGPAPNASAPPAPIAESALPSPPAAPIEPFPAVDPTAPFQ